MGWWRTWQQWFGSDDEYSPGAAMYRSGYEDPVPQRGPPPPLEHDHHFITPLYTDYGRLVGFCVGGHGGRWGVMVGTLAEAQKLQHKKNDPDRWGATSPG